MAYFAKLDENNIVLEVHSLNNNEMLDYRGQENEEVGKAFFIIWSGGYPHWKQTSYNGTIRKNFAAPGDVYDATRDAFIPPKPYNSWVLNEVTCKWEAPVPPPESPDGTPYSWNEELLNWTIARYNE